jgi:hypothetical protein
MTPPRILRLASPLLAAAIALPAMATAQNPDLALTQEERDSALAQYDQIFPIGGRKAVEKGFDLPLPLGFNVGFFSMTQDLEVSNLGLGFNGPTQPISFIKFQGASAKVNNLNARVDLWLFPFLNVYVMSGFGFGETNVKLAEPVPLETTAEFNGANIGLGVTAAFGFRRTIVVADYNHQWAFSSLLNAPVPANIFSPRLGRTFGIGDRQKRMRGTVWVGAMLQSLEAETNGSIKLSDVLGPGADSLFTDYQNAPWYQALGPAERAVADNMVERVQGGLDTTVVNYRLDKKPADPWNMLLGGTFDYGQHWGLRYEVGFIGRTSWMLMGNYRIRF